jgi:hypothetical protein
MFRSFFTTIFRESSAVLCAVTIPPADLRSLSLYYYAVCGRMYMSSVRVWCSCLGVICLFTSRSPTDKNTKHAQMTYTCNHTHSVIIQTQRTQISGRNSNGTEHSGGPPEDGREKRPKHVGVLHLQTRF